MGQKINVNPNLLQLFWKQVEVLDETKTTSEIGIQNGDEIAVIFKSGKAMIDIVRNALMEQNTRANLTSNSPPPGSSNKTNDIQSPLNVLIGQNNEYYNMLFSLLENFSEAITLRVWKLICSLPVHEKIRAMLSESNLQQNENVQFELLFDQKSLFKTLYSLQVILK